MVVIVVVVVVIIVVLVFRIFSVFLCLFIFLSFFLGKRSLKLQILELEHTVNWSSLES